MSALPKSLPRATSLFALIQHPSKLKLKSAPGRIEGKPCLCSDSGFGIFWLFSLSARYTRVFIKAAKKFRGYGFSYFDASDQFSDLISIKCQDC